MDRYIVDRIEGDYAVCEIGENIVNLPLEDLPNSINEGDILIFRNGDYYIDETSKEERMKEILDKMSDVWGN